MCAFLALLLTLLSYQRFMCEAQQMTTTLSGNDYTIQLMDGPRPGVCDAAQAVAHGVVDVVGHRGHRMFVEHAVHTSIDITPTETERSGRETR